MWCLLLLLLVRAHSYRLRDSPIEDEERMYKFLSDHFSSKEIDKLTYETLGEFHFCGAPTLQDIRSYIKSNYPKFHASLLDKLIAVRPEFKQNLVVALRKCGYKGSLDTTLKLVKASKKCAHKVVVSSYKTSISWVGADWLFHLRTVQ